MKIVGEQLQDWARKQKDDPIKDLFGRSAFNRFYYAAFLITREMLGEFDLRWRNTPHKSIPNLLETGVRKPVVSEVKTSVKKNLISESEKSAILSQLKIATSDLSNLLKEAYDLRVIADYEPETPVLDKDKILLLNNYKLNSAQAWPNKAEAYCKSIRKAWRDAGLA